VTDLLWLFVSWTVVNNFSLCYYMGMCPFIGATKRAGVAVRLGLATLFVMIITSIAATVLNAYVLEHAPYLRLISFIVVIASSVQFTELAIKKLSPPLFRALGIFLPLITSNCAVLFIALTQTNRQYGFIEGLVFALGGGGGFMLALFLMACLREESELSDVPQVVRGAGLTMVIAGILAMGFMGFAGLLSTPD
jgi:electron transport complex protein RnfA